MRENFSRGESFLDLADAQRRVELYIEVAQWALLSAR